MDVTSAATLNGLYKTTNNQSSVRQANQTSATDGSFDTILSNAMKMVDDTNSLQNNASAEAVSFALGESDNVHDLLIAERKANLALQYTVAVRNQFISGYNTIMNMQI